MFTAHERQVLESSYRILKSEATINNKIDALLVAADDARSSTELSHRARNWIPRLFMEEVAKLRGKLGARFLDPGRRFCQEFPPADSASLSLSS